MPAKGAPVMTYLLILIFAFLGAFAAIALFEHLRHERAVQKVVQNPHLEPRAETRMCTSCRSHVARYELLPNEHVMCANCVREGHEKIYDGAIKRDASLNGTAFTD